MSRLRPSNRDRLEAEYVRKVKLRSDAAKALAEMDKELLVVQAALDGVEAPRHPVRNEEGGRKDGLDRVSPGNLILIQDGDELAGVGEEGVIDEFAEDDDAPVIDWQGRSLRLMALVVGVLRMIKKPEEKQPKLAAHVALLALGVDCESMHQCAAAYGLSVERVRQRAEEIRVRFNLPKNQHNKSEMACQSYKNTATIFKKGAA